MHEGAGCCHVLALFGSHWELESNHTWLTAKLGGTEELASADPSVHYYLASMCLGSCV